MVCLVIAAPARAYMTNGNNENTAQPNGSRGDSRCGARDPLSHECSAPFLNLSIGWQAKSTRQQELNIQL
jgi:hypothetical protein